MIAFLKSRLVVVLLALSSSAVVLADDLSDLAGKWQVKRRIADGQEVVQRLSFKEKQFTFRLETADGTLRLYAEGDASVQSVGNIKVLFLRNIKAGQSESDLQSIGEEFQAAFRIFEGMFYLTANLDKDRNEPPRMDGYRRE